MQHSGNIYGNPDRSDRSGIDSNPYGFVTNADAERIASAALNNESVAKTDDIGKVPETLRYGADVITINSGRTGSSKGGHTHDGDVAGGSDEVTNEHAAHERHSLKDQSPTHARESFAGKHIDPRDVSLKGDDSGWSPTLD